MALTNREKASLNSETCSSVSISGILSTCRIANVNRALLSLGFPIGLKTRASSMRTTYHFSSLNALYEILKSEKPRRYVI